MKLQACDLCKKREREKETGGRGDADRTSIMANKKIAFLSPLTH